MITDGGRGPIRLGEVKGSSPVVFRTRDDEILVVRVNGTLVGVSNVCTHKMGPLNEGGFCKGVVECPWHGFQFDLATGSSVKGGAKPLRRYLIDIDSDGIAHAQEVWNAKP